jgi:hypothetical protein
MNEILAAQLAGLQRLPTKGLLTRYAEVFGDEARTWNRTWLLRRLAWRLQALAEGGLSERARRRAEELANDADLRMNPPAAPRAAEATPALTAVRPAPVNDQRLPPAGTILTRAYKGATVRVQVLEQGFAYQGRVYKSLSAVARAVTGSHCNGFHFFKLNPEDADEPQR